MNKITLISYIVIFSLVSLVVVKTTVQAEKSGSSPESGATSRIKTAYDWLVAKGANYGATDASDWSNNWGSMWNRIMESAAWEPDGTATEADVASTKTFYAGNGDRTIKTGTALPAVDFTNQQYSSRDDYGGPNGSGAEDYQGEESTWTNPATNVWKDSRTGVYWSASQGSMTNSFTAISLATCNFFTTTPRGAYDGLDNDCGVAINYCGTLNLASGGTSSTDWYLPSQKELQQAYIDGMYNKAGTNLTNAAAFTTTSLFWSSTEVSDNPDYAWGVHLVSGTTGTNGKDSGTSFRCVRRD